MDESAVTSSQMLDARSKEPFAMDSLDSEIVVTERVLFEANLEASGSTREIPSGAVTPGDDWKSHDSDALQAGSHVLAKETGRDSTNNINLNIGEQANQEIRGTSRIEEDYQESLHVDRTEQVRHEAGREGEEDRKRYDVEHNYRNEESTYDQDHTSWDQNQTYEEHDSHHQEENKQSSILFDVEKSPEKKVAGQKRPKATVSAETKARWAMLKSLAGVDKNEAEEEEEGIKAAHLSEGSKKEPSRDERYVQGGPSRSTEPLSPPKRPLSIAQGLSRPKMDFGDDKKSFARTSKAAVESAMRRSGSGRRQSSRGNVEEPDSSLSRAASVKRYMEKLRGDPHIDEAHFAGLPTVMEAGPGPTASNMAPDLHRKDEQNQHSRDKLEVDLDYAKNELQLRGLAENVKGSLKTEERSLSRHANDAGEALNRDKQNLERDLHRTEMNVKEGEKELRASLHQIASVPGLSQLPGALELEKRKLDQGIRNLDGALGSRNIGQALSQEGHAIHREAENLLGREGRNLEHAAHETEKALGVGQLAGALTQEGKKLGQDLHKIEGKLDAAKQTVSNALLPPNQPQQQIRQNTGSLSGPETSQKALSQPTPRQPQASTPAQAPPHPQASIQRQSPPHQQAPLRPQASNAPQTSIRQQASPYPQPLPPQPAVTHPQAPPHQQTLPHPQVQAPHPQNTSQHGAPLPQAPHPQNASQRGAPLPQSLPPHQAVNAPRPSPLAQQKSQQQTIPPSQMAAKNPASSPQQPPSYPGASQRQQNPTQQLLPQEKLPALQNIPPHQLSQTKQRRSQPQSMSSSRDPKAGLPKPNPESQVPALPNFPGSQQSRQQPFQAQKPLQTDKQPPVQIRRRPSPSLEQKSEQSQPLHGATSSQNSAMPQAPHQEPPPHVGNGLQDQSEKPRSLPNQLPPQGLQKRGGENANAFHHNLLDKAQTPKAESMQPQANVQAAGPDGHSPKSSQSINNRAVGVRQDQIPSTQIKPHESCSNPSHYAAGTCVKGSPCCVPSVKESHREESTSEPTLKSQASVSSNYRASSVQDEAADQVATESTTSLSPRLDASEPGPQSPSPHMAVFEHLIYGFKQSSENRMAASGGNPGFMDLMTGLFVKMAEDALPAIQQRLADNAHCQDSTQ